MAPKVKVYRPPARFLLLRRGAVRRSASLPGKALAALLAAAAVLLIARPVGTLVWRGVAGRAWTLVPDGVVREAIELSLGTTAISLSATLLLGTPLAYALARWRFTGKQIVNILVQLPIVLPPSVAGLALLITFGRRGVLGPLLQDAGIQVVFTSTAVIIAQTFVAMPFYVRAAQVGFRQVEPEVEQAALVDGAGGWTRFLFVTLPLARRALITGALLSWARALGEFGATILFAGSLQGRTQTMPLLIYSTFERNIEAAIWTALVLVGLAVAVLAVTMLLSREDHAEAGC